MTSVGYGDKVCLQHFVSVKTFGSAVSTEQIGTADRRLLDALGTPVLQLLQRY